MEVMLASGMPRTVLLGWGYLGSAVFTTHSGYISFLISGTIKFDRSWFCLRVKPRKCIAW